MKETDKNRTIVAEIISRAGRETDLRAKLKNAPRATLLEAGVDLDTDEDVVVLENTLTLVNAVLPPIAQQDKIKSQLDQMASRIMSFPEGIELRLVRQSAAKFYIVLPPSASDEASMELSDEALEAVAGGKGKTNNSTGTTQYNPGPVDPPEIGSAAVIVVVITPVYVS
jgi:hypothetical protein